jgi:hypothetical protein
MSITFNFRDGEITIPKTELEACLMIDWYISKLIHNDIDTEERNTFNIWEDKDVSMTILNSVRFNKFILNNDSLNLDYIYCLSDKWCVPENILQEIKDKMNQKNRLATYINAEIQQCRTCYIGYNINDNNSGACITHAGTYFPNMNHYSCCGMDNQSKGCKVGYHIHKIDKELYKLLSLSTLL